MKLAQISVRDLLLVTAIFALTIGWWLDRVALQTQLQAAQNESRRWQIDATVYAKLLQASPPTGIDFPTSLVPSIDP
jgi:hypothetical protein